MDKRFLLIVLAYQSGLVAWLLFKEQPGQIGIYINAIAAAVCLIQFLVERPTPSPTKEKG